MSRGAIAPLFSFFAPFEPKAKRGKTVKERSHPYTNQPSGSQIEQSL
ncbi:MAG: hypothetical protein AB1861_04085 [Cyanobacteriota bacterium]